MAVFEYRGILVGTGKPVKGVRDAENAKSLRTALRKDGVLLTVATEGKAAEAKSKKSGRRDFERLAAKNTGDDRPRFGARLLF